MERSHPTKSSQAELSPRKRFPGTYRWRPKDDRFTLSQHPTLFPRTVTIYKVIASQGLFIGSEDSAPVVLRSTCGVEQVEGVVQPHSTRRVFVVPRSAVFDAIRPFHASPHTGLPEIVSDTHSVVVEPEVRGESQFAGTGSTRCR